MCFIHFLQEKECNVCNQTFSVYSIHAWVGYRLPGSGIQLLEIKWWPVKICLGGYGCYFVDEFADYDGTFYVVLRMREAVKGYLEQLSSPLGHTMPAATILLWSDFGRGLIFYVTGARISTNYYFFVLYLHVKL